MFGDRGLHSVNIMFSTSNCNYFSGEILVLVVPVHDNLSLVVRKPFFLFAYAKTKTQISFAVTTKLISAFVFATRIVQSLFFLNPKFQASSHLLRLYSLVCIGPVRKPRRPVFSQRGSFIVCSRLCLTVFRHVNASVFLLPFLRCYV